MRVGWVATSPSTGRFEAVERETGEEALAERFEDLLRRGEGYIEVRKPQADFPCLTLGFRDGYAVASWFDDAESESLIHGDGSVSQDASVEVMFMEEPACFTGAFVMTLDRAREVLHEFIRSGTTGGRGMTPL